MIKCEKNMVMLAVENEKDLMNSFVHITKAVHQTLQTQCEKTEEEATMMVVDAVAFALDIDWDEDQEEPEEAETPEVPEEPQEEENKNVVVVEAKVNSPEELLEFLNTITKQARKDGEK